MEPFRRFSGLAVALWEDNLDTDQLVPGRECVKPAGASFANALLHHRRFRADGSEEPAFILNRQPYRGARVLVGGSNFGCGSSREQAAWAIRDFGFRAVIAPSFGNIFRRGCVINGVVPVIIERSTAEALVAELDEPAVLTIDLEAQTLTTPSGSEARFEILPVEREMLLRGVDEIGLTLELSAAVAAFQEGDRRRRPWVYETVGA